MDNLLNLVKDPTTLWPVLQENGHHVLEVIRNNPWTSVGAAASTVVLWRVVSSPRNLPPGPRGYPIIGAASGNSFSMDLPKTIFNWRKTYGEIISYYNFSELNIVLNSERTIREGFIKQSEELGHRGDLVDLFVATGLADELFCAPYNEAWKKNKKFVVTTLKNYGFGTARSESKCLDQMQYLEDYIAKAGGSPIDIYEQTKWVSAGAISSIILGAPGSWEDSTTSELVTHISNWYAALNETFMATFGYEQLSKTLQGFIARKEMGIMRQRNKEIVGFMSEKIKIFSKNASSREPESVAEAFVKASGSDDAAFDQIAANIVMFLPDAIDTTAIMVSWCLLYITIYPEVQKKLQEETNNVIGTSRLPTLADRAEMPFTQAVINEVLRLNLISPLSFPRVLKQKITIDGYTLPKGAVIKANFYGIHFDPDIFPDPFEFKPSRFILSDGTLDIALVGKINTFGLGNRKCPGEGYSRVLFFFFLSRIMQRFQITFDPTAPTPTLQRDSSFIFAKPEPYKVCLKAL